VSLCSGIIYSHAHALPYLPSSSLHPYPLKPLQDALRARNRRTSREPSRYNAKNLDTNESVGITAGPNLSARPAPSNSPILLTVFDQVAAGKAKWTEPLTVTAGNKVSGSGIIGSEFSDGVQTSFKAMWST